MNTHKGYKTQTITTHVFDEEGFIKYQDHKVMTHEVFEELRKALPDDDLVKVLDRLGLTERVFNRRGMGIPHYSEYDHDGPQYSRRDYKERRK